MEQRDNFFRFQNLAVGYDPFVKDETGRRQNPVFGDLGKISDLDDLCVQSQFFDGRRCVFDSATQFLQPEPSILIVMACSSSLQSDQYARFTSILAAVVGDPPYCSIPIA